MAETPTEPEEKKPEQETESSKIHEAVHRYAQSFSATPEQLECVEEKLQSNPRKEAKIEALADGAFACDDIDGVTRALNAFGLREQETEDRLRDCYTDLYKLQGHIAKELRNCKKEMETPSAPASAIAKPPAKKERDGR